MNEDSHDPVRRTAELINPASPDQLEIRLKQDIFASIGRINIARCEGALAFYNRVGWHEAFLSTDLNSCVPAEGIEPLVERYHARNLHDLAYVHPKHFEKMLGKPGAASLWESLKRFSQSQTG